MRGKHFVGSYKKIRAGITPADAGKTTAIQPDMGTRQDHPRGCGENV